MNIYINKKNNIRTIKFLVIIFITLFFSYPIYYIYASISCSITTQGACSGTVVLRMSGSSNAQAELPSQSTSVYDNNVVCCAGVTGLGNSCSENYAVIARLSGTTGTNAHVEKNDQTNVNYNNQKACLSSSSAGDEITIGYQASNCTGYDTTLFSMEKSSTNSMVGIPSAYNNKVCAKVYTQSITFNISSSSAGFGNVSPIGLRYATSDGIGSFTETESYSLNVNTNAPYGYIVMVKGSAPSAGIKIIDSIGGIPTVPSPGSKAFGIRAIATGGVGTAVFPYDSSGFAYDATDNTFSTIASASSGDGISTNYSIHSVATIDSLLDPGIYSTDLTYIVVANF